MMSSEYRYKAILVRVIKYSLKKILVIFAVYETVKVQEIVQVFRILMFHPAKHTHFIKEFRILGFAKFFGL